MIGFGRKSVALLFFTVLTLVVYPQEGVAGTPHVVYGKVANLDGSTPANHHIEFQASVEGRPDETLSEKSVGCGYAGGWYWIEVGNFNGSWAVGETLKINFYNSEMNKYQKTDMVLDRQGHQELAVIIGKSDFELNLPPLANAGTDQTVLDGADVVLNGINSFDPEGPTLFYFWEQVGGIEVQLNHTDQAEASFTAPQVGPQGEALIFRLTVIDPFGATDVDECIINVTWQNDPPTANAGIDQTVKEKETVVLNASGSFDRDGGIASYLWVQIRPTEDTRVVLSDSTSPTPSFTSPALKSTQNLSLEFRLIVTDVGGLKASDSCIINVTNLNDPPVADAGVDQTVMWGVTAWLDASGSFDPDGDSLIYLWKQFSGRFVKLSNPTAKTPSFTTPLTHLEDIRLVFGVIVTDSNGLKSVDTCIVNVSRKLPPVADAGKTQQVIENEIVTLDASASYDLDEEITSYEWRQIDGPQVQLSDPTAIKPTFSAPLVLKTGGSVMFEVTVTDKSGLSSSDTCIINITSLNDPPVSNAGPDMKVDEKTSFQLDGSGSYDSDGDSITYIWKQMTGPPASISNANSVHPTVIAPDVAAEGDIVVFRLIVEDELGLRHGDEVSITVEDTYVPPDKPAVVNYLITPAGYRIGIQVSGDALVQEISIVNPADLPSGTVKASDLLYGMFYIRLAVQPVGAKIDVTFYVPSTIPEGYAVYKYGNQNIWYDYSDYTTFSPDRQAYTIRLEDGGVGDDDGIPNGVIIDPSGLAKVSSGDTDTGGDSGGTTDGTPGGGTTTGGGGSSGSDGGGGGGCFIKTTGDPAFFRAELFKCLILAFTIIIIVLAIGGALHCSRQREKIVMSGLKVFRLMIRWSFRKSSIIFFLVAVMLMQSEASATSTTIFDLKAGLNGISIPYIDTGLDDAHRLSLSIPGCDRVKIWDAENQHFVEYQKGAAINNFSIEPGQPVFVHVTSDTQWAVAGPAYGEYVHPLKTTSTTSVNAIAVPLNRVDLTDAEKLVNAVPNADTIWYWNPAENGLIGHPAGTTINNFAVKPGYAYLVNVNADISWDASGGEHLSAVLNCNTVTGNAPMTVEFNVNAHDSSGSIISEYRIDFGDGTEDWVGNTAGITRHTYTTKGNYTAVLTVTNNRGQSATADVDIMVNAGRPVATAEASPSNGAAPLVVNFTGTGTDPDGTIVMYEWDFDGDGWADHQSKTTGNVSRTFMNEGVYNVVFRVIDNDGLIGTADIKLTTIRVGAAGSPTATASATPTSGIAPLAVSFNGHGDDPNGQIVKYEWDFDGDGVFDWYSTTTGTTNHTYTSAGKYTPSFRVTDDQGLQGIDYLSIEVDIQAGLTINDPDRVFSPQAGETLGITPKMSISASTTVKIKNPAGTVVRTLAVNAGATAQWDGKNDSGNPVTDGLYYAILEYTINNEKKVFDPFLSTGNQAFLPQFDKLNPTPFVFSPFDDQYLPVGFTLDKASRVSIYLKCYSDSKDIGTLVDHFPFGTGHHIVHWTGTDNQNRLIDGCTDNEIIFGLIAHTLPDNAFLVDNGKPVISNLTATPNYFSPFSRSRNFSPMTLAFTLSEPSLVRILIFSMGTNKPVKEILLNNAPAGNRTATWDGIADTGYCVRAGDYKISVQAWDMMGNASLIRDTVARISY